MQSQKGYACSNPVFLSPSYFTDSTGFSLNSKKKSGHFNRKQTAGKRIELKRKLFTTFESCPEDKKKKKKKKKNPQDRKNGHRLTTCTDKLQVSRPALHIITTSQKYS